MGNKLTGRIVEAPSQLLNEEILEPQFMYEVENLLPAYIQIEQVMLLEYVRMGWIESEDANEIALALQSITSETLVPDLKQNMSDIAFAIEHKVVSSLIEPVACWHMDRSRNDIQACAQLMFGRTQWLLTIKYMKQLIEAVAEKAEQYRQTPMPGYTHYQSAQVITPGFYLATINEELLHHLQQWIQVYQEINQCPLGSGAMAGVELAWDRDRLASLLGFHQPRASALAAVASREWLLRISAELSLLSVLVSRFVTDLIQWGSSEMCLIDLPDQLSGISSAMPQKKNFPILERIRGKSAHLSAFHIDMVLGQRNTAFTNLVETSKEASTHFLVLLQTTQSLLRLLTTVVDHLSFHEERMLAICKRDYFGGFTLANRLTMDIGIPYRKSQVIVGQYIRNVTARGLLPSQEDAYLLLQLCKEEGFILSNAEEMIRSAFDVHQNLYAKQSSGSTHPEQVHKLLLHQQVRGYELEQEVNELQVQLHAADAKRQRLLGELHAITGKGVGL
ncbi:lyase family protein [Paenibacillus sp. N1-5-1-14]|uniref:argininosuccinate lyase n=1 Tax=Paenibacillus radicibacter TaxID=2972488 RepID=UPI002158C904|nr:lyase family protein [Paenibacillus radicibacter]MCR8643276.1 lyase family protein [Paenibacillus radicibacter]